MRLAWLFALPACGLGCSAGFHSGGAGGSAGTPTCGVAPFARSFPATGNHRAGRVSAAGGRVALVGVGNGGIDFGDPTGVTPMPDQDLFAARFTAAGAGVDARADALNGDTVAGAIAAGGSIAVAARYSNPNNPPMLMLDAVALKGVPGAQSSFSGLLDDQLKWAWAADYPGADNNHQVYSRAVAQGPDGVVTAGAFNGSMPFSPPVMSTGGDDIYLASYDLTGKPRWTATFGGMADDAAHGLAVAADGSIALAGTFDSKTIAFGGTTLSGGNRSGFVTKLDADGKPQWARGFAAPSGGSQLAQAVAIDPEDGGVVVGGSVDDKLEIGGNTYETNTDGTAAFVVRFDAGGQFEWLWLAGPAPSMVMPTPTEQITGVAVAGGGEVRAIGELQDSLVVDAKTTLTATGMKDANNQWISDLLALRFDRGGKLLGAKSYGDGAPKTEPSLAADASTGCVYLAGTMQGTMQLGAVKLVSQADQPGNVDAYLALANELPPLR